MLKQIKIDAPSAYSGKLDLDMFDKWALEVQNWVKLNWLSEWIAIVRVFVLLPNKSQ